MPSIGPPQRTDEGKPCGHCSFSAGLGSSALIRRFAPPSPEGEGFYSLSSASNCFKAAPPLESGRPPVANASSGRRTHSTGPF